jgi:3-phenylpropionate/trans-cinnamate dioxygenase ferredoxin reductase subunit
MRSVAVVGAGVAGLSAARALRQQGFDERLTLIGDPKH